MDKNKGIACGVIGAGWWGSQMCDFILESDHFRISSIYDTSKEAVQIAAGRFHCAVAESVDELVRNTEIECIFIFSPNHLHLEHTTAAAIHNKHIFLEKPIANIASEAEEIAKVCRDHGVILAIGHNVRHYSIFQEAKKIISLGSIGEIVYIECNRSRAIGFGIDEQSWRFYKKSCNGGPLIQMAIHLLDAIRFITGLDIVEVQTLSVKRFLKTENDESFSVNTRLRSNTLLHLFTSYVSPESFYINFFGTKGILFADPFNGLYLQDGDSTKKQRIEYPENKAEVVEILEFYDSIIKNQPYKNPTVEESIDNVRAIETILKSV